MPGTAWLSQVSSNRKRVENIAKRKLDSLIKESKIRDHEDPNDFSVSTLPPPGKPGPKAERGRVSTRRGGGACGLCAPAHTHMRAPTPLMLSHLYMHTCVHPRVHTHTHVHVSLCIHLCTPAHEPVHAQPHTQPHTQPLGPTAFTESHGTAQWRCARFVRLLPCGWLPRSVPLRPGAHCCHLQLPPKAMELEVDLLTEGSPQCQGGAPGISGPSQSLGAAQSPPADSWGGAPELWEVHPWPKQERGCHDRPKG